MHNLLVRKLQEKSNARTEVLIALNSAMAAAMPATLDDAIAVIEFHHRIAEALREFFGEDETIDRQLVAVLKRRRR